MGTAQRKVSRGKQRGLRVREGGFLLSSSSFPQLFFPSALHFVACENSRFSSLLLAACRTSLPEKRPNRRGAGRKGCFRRLSISHSLPSERPARLRKDNTVLLRVLFWFAARYQHCSSRGWITPVFQGRAVCRWTGVRRRPSRTCML